VYCFVLDLSALETPALNGATGGKDEEELCCVRLQSRVDSGSWRRRDKMK